MASVSLSAQYLYDQDGRRRNATVNGVKRSFVYAGDQEIAETLYDPAKWYTLSARYVPGARVDERVAMITVSASDCDGDRSRGLSGPPCATAARHYYVGDRLGSTIAMVHRHNGNVTEKYVYSPYGVEIEVVPGQIASGNPFRYTGQRFDPETGWYHYKARTYDPRMGRFLQTDPIGYQDQINLYAYVYGDPLNHTDPTGMCGLNDEKCWEWVKSQPDKSDPANNPYVAMVDEAQDDVGNLAINAGLVLIDIANVPSGESLAMIAAKGKVDDTLGIVARTIDDTPASTPVGHRGSPMDVQRGTNAPGSVGDRDYSGHAFDQMQGRGIPPSAVEDAIGAGARSAGRSPGTSVYRDTANGVSVVVDDQSGRVVTVITTGRQ